MKTRWPLGLGNYTRSVVHTFVAGGIGVFALVVTMIACLEAGDHSVDFLRFAASCRTWGLLLLAVFSSHGAVLYLLRPGVLRLLTPTPLGRDKLWRVLTPDHGLLLMALPYALALIAGVAQWESCRPWSSAAWMFCAAMLFRTLVPLFALVGVLLRKLLLPAGHWIVWGAVVASAVGLSTGVSWIGAEGITLACLEPAWLWLPIGIALIPLGSLAAWACNRIATARVSREELIEYAYPVETPATSKPRSMLVEVLHPGPRFRRAVYLVQEAFALHRAADWGKAGVVWGVAFGGMLYAASHIGGSAAHMFLTAVPTAAFLVWSVVRGLRIRKGKLAFGAPDHALPVGYIEKVFAQLAVLTCVFVVTGILAALGVHLVWSPDPDEIVSLLATPLPNISPIRASVENLAQLWLLLAAIWVYASTLGARKASRKKLDLSLRGLAATVVSFALYMGTILAALSFFHLSILASEAWTPILAVGGRNLFGLAYMLSFAGEMPLADQLMPDLWAHHTIPLWHFEILAWSLPVLVLAYHILVLRRIGRGRAHPTHKSLFPVVWWFSKTA